jgi:hypothetical protein
MQIDENLSISDRQLAEYLLGMLQPEETERLDDLSITNDAIAARLQAVEDDLIDDYIRGNLSGVVRDRFESFYLASPKRRERVRFAEAFLGMPGPSLITSAKPSAREDLGSAQTSQGSSFSAIRPRLRIWQLAFAASLLLLVPAIVYLVLENSRLRNRASELRAERAALEQRQQELQTELNDQRSADAELEKELERVREALARLDQADKGDATDREASVVAMTLMPPIRGAGETPLATLKPQTEYLLLTLRLEAEDLPEYRVALKDPQTNALLWRGSRLRARQHGPGRAITVSLPARLLKAQTYVIEVSGIRSDGSPEVIGNYPLRVVIR